MRRLAPRRPGLGRPGAGALAPRRHRPRRGPARLPDAPRHGAAPTRGRWPAGSASRATPRRRFARGRWPSSPSTTPAGSVDLFVEQLALVDYSTQQVLVGALTRAAAGQGPAFADRILPLMAAGEAATRSVVLKILLGMPDRREVVRRYIVFSKTLAGWARDRALESMRAFGNDLLEPTIELLSRPRPGGARLGDARGPVLRGRAHRAGHDRAAQGPGLVDPHHRGRDAGPAEGPARGRRPSSRRSPTRRPAGARSRRSAGSATCGRCPASSELLQDPAPEVRIEVIQALSHFEHPQMLDFVRNVAKQDPSRAVRARALEIAQRHGDAHADEARRRGRAQAGRPRREVRRRRAEAQPPPRGHAQQRGVRPPPLGRPAAGHPPRRRPRPRAGRALHRGADRGHGPRDPDRRAVGEAGAREAARLLLLHPDRRALPRERVRRPEAA